MPNRLLREGLMESEKVLSLPVEARWLFVIIVLSADDVGLFEATEFKLARRADINRDLAGKLLGMLSDVDLVRFYVVDGKRFGFVPRFRQRIQLKRMKHPAPPAALLMDDADALSKINHLATGTTVVHPLDSGCASTGQPSEAEAEAEKSVSVSASQKPRRQRKAADLPACPYDEIVAQYHEVLPDCPGVRLMDAGRQKKLREFWRFALTSKRTDGKRRATNAAEALEWTRSYFVRSTENGWLMGTEGRSPGHENWRPDLDFLLSKKGMKQVIEKTRAA